MGLFSGPYLIDTLRLSSCESLLHLSKNKVSDASARGVSRVSACVCVCVSLSRLRKEFSRFDDAHGMTASEQLDQTKQKNVL